MGTIVNLYSTKKGELNRFLSSFFNTEMEIYNKLSWQKSYNNPIEVTDLIGVYVDNYDNYSINLWICLDNNVYINVSEKNADALIRYIYERYPS
ncbi:MAG: hypothetical protein HFJ47_00455 [Clostridia bacterium]|nr:hypothetical protein [Clostridia bacterium]